MTATIMMTAAILSLGVAAPKVAVFGFEAVGVDSVTGVVATSVFRTELEETKQYELALVDDIIAALGSDRAVARVNEACSAAGTMDAAKAVIGSVSKLGEQTIAKVQLLDVQSQKVEFTDQLGTTSNQELDIILKRLAKAVATQVKASTKVELGEVTKKEAKEPLRREAWWGGGARFGGFFPISSSFGKGDAMLGGSGIALYETPDFFAEFDFRYYWKLSTENYEVGHFSPLTVNVFRIFSRSDFAPYAGGGVGVGFYSFYSFSNLQYNSESGQGFVVGLGGGLLMFRTYDFHVLADGRYYFLFGGGGVQHGPSITFGIALRRSKGGPTCCGCGF